jgi:hypothetical protein
LKDRYLFDVTQDPDQSTDIADENPDVVASMEKNYADWWSGWCTGPDAVIDPMHLQTPGFEYFPVEEMKRRLEHVERGDQLKDMEQRLEAKRRSSPSATQPESHY